MIILLSFSMFHSIILSIESNTSISDHQITIEKETTDWIPFKKHKSTSNLSTFDGLDNFSQYSNVEKSFTNQDYFMNDSVYNYSISNGYISNLSLELESSKLLLDTGSDEVNDSYWKPLNDEFMGNTFVSLENESSYSFSNIVFENNGSSHYSAASNNYLNFSSLPNPLLYDTTFDFSFRNKNISENLLTNPHHTQLQFIYNNASINFIFSDNGSNKEDLINDTYYITPPPLTDIDIWVDDVPNNIWKDISLNITQKLKQLFSEGLYGNITDNFSILKEIRCSIFSFPSEYHYEFDIKNLKIFVNTTNFTVIREFKINNNTIYTNNNSIYYEGNFSDIKVEFLELINWNQSSISIFNIRFISYISEEFELSLTDWNQNLCFIEMIFLPSNVTNFTEMNLQFEVPKEYMNLTIENGTGTLTNNTIENLYSKDNFTYSYCSDLSELVVIEASVENYLEIIYVSQNIQITDNLEVSGSTKKTSESEIGIIIYNQTFNMKFSLLNYVDGSFKFILKVSDYSLLGNYFLDIYYNTSLYFGRAVSQFQIVEFEYNDSIISNSEEFIEIYQFESLLMNISLFRNNLPYDPSNDSELKVFLMNGPSTFLFNRTKNTSNFILNVSTLKWNPDEYITEIYAVGENDYFAIKSSIIKVKENNYVWNFSNFNKEIPIETNFMIEVGFYKRINDSLIPVTYAEVKLYYHNTSFDLILNDKGLFSVTIQINQSSTSLDNFYFQALIDKTFLSSSSCNIFPIDKPFAGYTIVESKLLDQTEIVANQSYWLYFNISYPNNGSYWSMSLQNILNSTNQIERIYLYQKFELLNITTVNSSIYWIVERSQYQTDCLAIKLIAPKSYYYVIEEKGTVEYYITMTSQGEVKNTTITIEINNSFNLNKDISFFDEIDRNITEFMNYTLLNSKIMIQNIDIKLGVEFYLKIRFHKINGLIGILDPIKKNSQYNEEISGSWFFNHPHNYSIYVYYKINDTISFYLLNREISNQNISYGIVKLSLPLQKWGVEILVWLRMINLDFNTSIESESQEIRIQDKIPPEISYYISSDSDEIWFNLMCYEPQLASGILSIKIYNEITGLNITNTMSKQESIFFNKFQIKESIVNITILDYAFNSVNLTVDINDLKKSVVDNSLFLNQTIFTLFLSLIILIPYLSIQFLRKRSIYDN